MCLPHIIVVSFAIWSIAPLSHADQVDDYLRDVIREKSIPGLSVAVLVSGEVVKAGEYGWANIEWSQPMSPATVFQIASVTKTVTSAAILMLVEQRKLRLETKLGEALKDLPDSWKSVTIAHCLSHTSGLPDFSEIESEFLRNPQNDRGLLQRLFSMPVKPAGAECAYNQTGYLMLSKVIEAVSGETYTDFVRSHIFKPLEMEGSRFIGYASPHALFHFTDVVPKAVTQYIFDNGRVRHADFYHPVWHHPTGGLQMTRDDLVRWERALAAGTIVSRSLLERAWSPARLNDGSEAKLWWGSYGLGWFIGEHRGERYVGHPGGGAVWICRFPKQAVAVILLTNLENANASTIALGVADFFLHSDRNEPK